MTVEQAVSLINDSRIRTDGINAVWADLGCGSGLFTRALAGLLPPGSTIYAFDKNDSFTSKVTEKDVSMIFRQADFVADGLDLQDLDGVLMCNSLHYVKEKPAFLQKIKLYLKPHAVFIIVEYDMDEPVAKWVPYPLSFLSLATLFREAGYTAIRKLAERPSIYGRANLYSVLISK